MIQSRNTLLNVTAKTFLFVFHLLPPHPHPPPHPPPGPLDTIQMYSKCFLLAMVGALTPCTSREGLLKALAL